MGIGNRFKGRSGWGIGWYMEVYVKLLWFELGRGECGR